MAEVGQRLGGGAYRLSALRTGHSRPRSPGGSPGSLLISCSSGGGRAEEESDEREASKSKTTRRRSQKLSREKSCENITLLCATSLELSTPSLPSLMWLVETRESLPAHKTALFRSAGFLQEKLLPGRMTSWTRGAVSIHPDDAFRSPQQLRAFCTVLFLLSEEGSAWRGWRRLKLHPDALKASSSSSSSSRSYSWSSEDAPLLHRSRTAYYDILSVSPTATQSQIKTAYYKQSFIYHPDKNPGSEEATQRFSEISEAYTVLGNINLRRKYDRGILSQSDIHHAGRPSSKETTGRSTGSSHQQQRARRFSQPGGKPIFDFDAFYRAHYGEQLQRERDMRARKQRMEEEQKANATRWREKKMMEVALTVAVGLGGLILVSLAKP